MALKSSLYIKITETLFFNSTFDSYSISIPTLNFTERFGHDGRRIVRTVKIRHPLGYFHRLLFVNVPRYDCVPCLNIHLLFIYMYVLLKRYCACVFVIPLETFVSFIYYMTIDMTCIGMVKLVRYSIFRCLVNIHIEPTLLLLFLLKNFLRTLLLSKKINFVVTYQRVNRRYAYAYRPT